MKIAAISILSLIAVFLFPFSSMATQIHSIQGNEGLGTYSGSVSYNLLDDYGQLSVTITNTMQNYDEGYITALAFFLPNELISVTGLSATNSAFQLITDVDAPPYSGFGFGASLSNKWLGEGNPHSGIAIGDSATFTFDLTGPGVSDLRLDNFVKKNVFMLARFKGIEPGGGSDKVPAVMAAVPEPGTIILLSSGLLGAALFKLKRKMRKQLPGSLAE